MKYSLFTAPTASFAFTVIGGGTIVFGCLLAWFPIGIIAIGIAILLIGIDLAS